MLIEWTLPRWIFLPAHWGPCLVVAAADCPVKVWWTTKKLAEVALHQEWRWLHSNKLVQVKQQTTVELEGPHPQPVRSVWHATLRKSRVHNLECQDLEPTKTPDTWPNVLLAHYRDESQHPRWYVGLVNPIFENSPPPKRKAVPHNEQYKTVLCTFKTITSQLC